MSARTPRTWARVKMVFQEAVELRPAARDTFLTHACAGDPALRSEVDSLIASHDDERPFLDATPIAGAGKVFAAVLADEEDAVPRLARGARIGEYEIIERLGAGGMGEVYRAYDAKLDRFVALKILHDGPGGHTNARILREARAVSALDHPNICTIYEVGNFDGRPYLAMEYIAGRPLNEILPPAGFLPDVVVKYGTQIADALAHAHERGVIHRDLKSANVVVTPQGRAKVLDFGLARRTTITGADDSRPHTVTDIGNMAGTPAYMAPELLRDRKADPRSDIWALGVLLHEMACGRRPFEGQTPFEITSAILRDAPPPLPSTVPAFLQSIVSRCLAPDIRDRFQNAADVVRALEMKELPGRGSALRSHVLTRRNVMRLAAVVAVLVLTNRAGVSREYTRDPEAYALYMRGRAQAEANDSKSNAAAVEFFKAAVDHDPNYAPAHAGLAVASAMKGLFFAAEDDVPAWQAAAHQAAQRALQLRPEIAETHEALAAVYRATEFNWVAAIDESGQALALNPMLERPHKYRSSGFMHLGLLDVANSEAAAAMTLNPKDVIEPLRVQGYAALLDGRYADAVRLLESARKQPAEWNLANAYYYAGRKEDAEASLRKLRDSARSRRRAEATLASFLAARGETAQAQKLIDVVLAAPYRDHHVAYALGVAYAQLGMNAEAVMWLANARNTGFACYPWFARDPLLEPLKQVPAFQQFLDDFKRSWQTMRARYAVER